MQKSFKRITIIYPDPKTIHKYLQLTGVDSDLYILDSPQMLDIMVIEQNHVANIKAYGYIMNINCRFAN